MLAFDTSGPYCAAAFLWRGDAIIRCEAMARGQAERLMGLLEEMLADAGQTWRDLDAIGVGVGPGNFTGVRISVAAARGLALALKIPAYGVNGFEQRGAAETIACVPGPRDQFFVNEPSGPRLMTRVEAAAAGLNLLDCSTPESRISQIAQTAAARYPRPADPPRPLYIKPADAAPPRDAPPRILDDA